MSTFPRGRAADTGYLAATVVARHAADALSTALVCDAGALDALPAMRNLGIDRVLVFDSEQIFRTLKLT